MGGLLSQAEPNYSGCCAAFGPGGSIRMDDDYDSLELHPVRCEREYRLALDAKHELDRLAPTLRLRKVACATRNYGPLCAHADGLAAHTIGHGLASEYQCEPGRCPPHGIGVVAREDAGRPGREGR
jgi:hypothetical protein